MKGSGFLKVCGILMIIGGGLALIFGLVAVLGVAAIATLAAAAGEAGASVILYISAFLLLCSAVIELVAGILGVKNCKRPEKANSCIVMGILVIALSVVSLILNIAGGSDLSLWSFLSSTIIPVLYLIGAFLNKQQTQ